MRHNAWRGVTLQLSKSHLYAGGVVLRHPLTLGTVMAGRRKAALRYARLNGFSVMNARPADLAGLEERL